MPYIPVPNTAQVELVMNWQGQIVQNVLHYVKASPWDITQLTELCQACASDWDASLQALMPTTLSLIEVAAIDMSAQDAESVTYSTNLPLVGTNVSPSMPNNVAVCITKRTAKRGRSFRGRIYHPGLIDAYVTGNTVNADAVSGLVSAYSQFLSQGLTGDEANLCVVSRYSNNQPRSEGVATLVTNLTCDGVVDSQRRRLPGRGS